MSSRPAAALLAVAVTVLVGPVCARSASASVLAGSAAAKPVTARAEKPQSAGASLLGVVSQKPVSWTPDVYGGGSCGKLCRHSTVKDTVVVGSEVVVAGTFGQVCSPVRGAYARCPDKVNADYLFAFRLGTGAIDPHFAPVITSGPVNALAAGPDDTVYVGGAFTKVNGVSAGNLARLYVTPGARHDGQLVPGFIGHADGRVDALAIHGNSLYLAGDFDKVDTHNVGRVARLNATTGRLDRSFQFTFGSQSGGTPTVGTMSLSADGSLLAVGGSFLTVNGEPIPRVALIDTGGGLGATAALADWAAPIFNDSCLRQHDYVEALDLSPDGSYLVVADTGFMPASGTALCDAAARFDTGATGMNVQPAWVSYTGGDSLRSVLVTGSVVYIGGHQRWANNECGRNTVCEANAVLVDGIAAVDPGTGLALAWWHPQTARGVGVQSLTALPAGLYPNSHGGLILGTDVTTIGGRRHSKLALFPDNYATAPAAGGPIQSGIFSQGRLDATEGSGPDAGVAAMCMDDPGDATTPGTAVELSTCVNDDEQNWTIKPEGTVRIHGLCLDAPVSGQSSPVRLEGCTGARSQSWAPGAGNRLVDQKTGLCLADPGGSTNNNTPLQADVCDGNISQSWPLPTAPAPPPPPPSGPLFAVQTQDDTQVSCADDSQGVTTAGNPVVAATCLGYPSEDWTVQPDGTIQFDGRCMTADGKASGSGVALDPCTGAATQSWYRGQNYELVNSGAQDMCLNDPDVSDANGSVLQITQCDGSGSQEWRLPTY